jgi:threonine dehydrogenase-like Zn-dependent dehydrogenase
MRAVVFPGDQTVSMRDLPDPVPGQGEVLVRVKASAICGSDLSALRGEQVVGTKPEHLVPGHEIAGTIEEVGIGAYGVSVGDRVSIYLAVGCMRCEYCRAGNIMVCPKASIVGFDRWGGDAELVVVPAINCMRLPRELSFVDPFEHRRELGLRMGAHEVLPAIDNTVTSLSASRGRGGPDVVLECSGNPKAQSAALDVVRPFGRVAFVGESRVAEINPSDQFVRKLITVIGAWYFPIWQYDEITHFLIERKVPVSEMVSHRFQLEDAPRAFEMLLNRSAEKMVFEL